LPGGETAIRQPWRTAVAVLADVLNRNELAKLSFWSGRELELPAVLKILDSREFSPITTSAGRLFDAAAAILMAIDRADFDGQPAMRLEAIADCNASGQYEFPLSEGDVLELDWRPLFAGLIEDCANGIDPGTASMRFHRTLAAAIAEVSRRAGMPTILTGGVFQNRLLTELVVEQLSDWGQPLGLPGVIPPNDGGLAAGQLAFAVKSGENNLCV
jgi:hydrogenase maturation protein HypF